MNPNRLLRFFPALTATFSADIHGKASPADCHRLGRLVNFISMCFVLLRESSPNVLFCFVLSFFFFKLR